MVEKTRVEGKKRNGTRKNDRNVMRTSTAKVGAVVGTLAAEATNGDTSIEEGNVVIAVVAAEAVVKIVPADVTRMIEDAMTNTAVIEKRSLVGEIMITTEGTITGDEIMETTDTVRQKVARNGIIGVEMKIEGTGPMTEDIMRRIDLTTTSMNEKVSTRKNTFE